MAVNVEIKRKITVDGKEYESLDQVPGEVRVAVQKALASPAVGKTTIHINGKTYSSVEDLPAPLRALVGAVTSLVLNRPAGATSERRDAVRPEPVLSMKRILIAIGLATLLLWLARLVL